MGIMMPKKIPRAKRRGDSEPVKTFKAGGLYENIYKKRARIAAGSGEKMRRVGAKGAPTSADFIKSARTAKR
jgi:hypothetical protein